ncbi:MAG: glycosyltransferase [Eudoraea sp.]|uniref:glycosyltransferase n=1 Tax=Eudoraea sp. TaxID=1979955 RepID=UPI003C774B4B
MELSFSLIIPVFNRPDEIRELLESLVYQTYDKSYEIVIIEDGSITTSETVIDDYKETLNITYLFKDNTGPGHSRNFGMEHAKGNYFIILDSDCVIPVNYLKEIAVSLNKKYVDCFGGPDSAHESFSNIQKAINYAMTSIFTTGGIRGNNKTIDKFQPRSFNMGISKKAYEDSGGFGNIHPGEDPDLSMRLWKKGYDTKLISEAFVYHKRRISFNKFFIQVKKFGMVRPILNAWHPGSSRIYYWFPSFFCIGLIISLLLLFVGSGIYLWPIILYTAYFSFIFLDALTKNKNLMVAFLAIIAVLIQFLGYGYGFLKSVILVNFTKSKPQELFPELFFKQI